MATRFFVALTWLALACFMPGCATTQTTVSEDGAGGFDLRQKVTTTIGAKQAEGATDFRYKGEQLETDDSPGMKWEMGSGSAAKGQEGESIQGITSAIGSLVLNAIGQIRGNGNAQDGAGSANGPSVESIIEQFRALTPEQRAALREALRASEH